MFATIKRALTRSFEGWGGTRSFEQAVGGIKDETEITLTQKTYPATLYKTYDNRGVLFDDEGNATFYSRYRDAFRGAARKGLNREDILLVA
jgi:hypothetical protein